MTFNNMIYIEYYSNLTIKILITFAYGELKWQRKKE